jgi:hypothetical protein
LAKFSDLSVQSFLLFLETNNGGRENFCGEFCRHSSSSIPASWKSLLYFRGPPDLEVTLHRQNTAVDLVLPEADLAFRGALSGSNQTGGPPPFDHHHEKGVPAPHIDKLPGATRLSIWRGLSETLRMSLRALREHGSQLVFENKAQAVRLLMRARDFGRTEANWQVQELIARRLIRVERWKEEPQPSLFGASYQRNRVT